MNYCTVEIILANKRGFHFWSVPDIRSPIIIQLLHMSCDPTAITWLGWSVSNWFAEFCNIKLVSPVIVPSHIVFCQPFSFQGLSIFPTVKVFSSDFYLPRKIIILVLLISFLFGHSHCLDIWFPSLSQEMVNGNSLGLIPVESVIVSTWVITAEGKYFGHSINFILKTRHILTNPNFIVTAASHFEILIKRINIHCH